MAVAMPVTTTQGRVFIHHRKNINKMTAEQVADFRRAVSQMMAIGDDRGWQYWAGIHGLPLPMYCQHGTELFLPWHRAYLYFTELALQDQVETVSLPWWNWAGPNAHQIGIPVAYSEATDPGGNENPLASSVINDVARQQWGEGAPERTFRSPGDPAELPSQDQLQAVVELNDFFDFSQELENIHNNIHVWVGGTMSEVPLAAYDPVFWAHHSMIDRGWRLWQLRHTRSGLSDAYLNQVLSPFQMTVRDTLDVTALGYDYASYTQHMPGGGVP
jgi:tyrosinase